MLLYTLVFAYVCRIVNARRNITLDDDDSVIQYFGHWLRTPLDPLNAGGHHMVTANAEAYATFNFSGIAIYFYSPLWPFRVTTDVSLDGRESSLLDLRDYDVPFHQDGAETAPSQIVWYMDGLDNVRHVLNVSVGPGEDLAILDTLVYTILEAGDPTSVPPLGSTVSQTHTRLVPTSSQTATLYPTNPASTSSSTKIGLSITLALVCSIFGIIVLWAFYWYWRRRRQRISEDSSSYAGSARHVNISEANSRLPSYPRTTGLANARRHLVNMTDKPSKQRPFRPPPSTQSQRHPSRSAAPSAAAARGARPRRAKKQLSTIPEMTGDQEDLEESASQRSSIGGTATPDSSPSLSLRNNDKPDDWMEPELSETTTIRLVTDRS